MTANSYHVGYQDGKYQRYPRVGCCASTSVVRGINPSHCTCGYRAGLALSVRGDHTTGLS